VMVIGWRLSVGMKLPHKAGRELQYREKWGGRANALLA